MSAMAAVAPASMAWGEIALLIVAGLFFCGLAAIVAGIVALVRINSSGGRLHGKGFAVAAIVIGTLTMLGTPLTAAIAIPMLLAKNVMAADRQAAMEAKRRAVEDKTSGRDIRTLWKLRGGKVLVYGRSEEAERVVRALETKDSPSFNLGTSRVTGHSYSSGPGYERHEYSYDHPDVSSALKAPQVRAIVLVDIRYGKGHDRQWPEKVTKFVRKGGLLVVMARSRGSEFPQDIWPKGSECPLPVRQAVSETSPGRVAIRGRSAVLKPRSDSPPGGSVVGMGGGFSCKMDRMLELDKLPAGAAVWGYGWKCRKPFIAAVRLGKGQAVLVAATPKWGGLHGQEHFGKLMATLVPRELGPAAANPEVKIEHEIVPETK